MNPQTEYEIDTALGVFGFGEPSAECCACRWIVWGEECGHPESAGITSPHTHCEQHQGNVALRGAD